MIAPMDLQARVQQYLAERRRLGFHLRSPGQALPNFARFVEASKHAGALTVELMAQWARQAQGGEASAETAARKLAWLRPFLRWLRQFEPQTEVPDDSTFGPIPGRLTPHIYRSEEIAALLQAARQLGPRDGLRAATYETLFGLIASAGLRISEAIALADIDVDLEAGVLTVRQAKFGKSRLVPVHPSVIAHLAAYRALRRLQLRTTPLTPWRSASASDVRATAPATRLG
jgi:site-specific recombinase XerD